MSWIYVTEAGARLGLREGRYVISREHEVLAEVPSEIVEGVTVIDAVQVSSRAIVDFLERDIPVTWLSTTGKFFGRLKSTSAQDMSRVKEQFARAEDAAFCLDLARLTVFRKIYNQRAILRSYNRRAESRLVQQTYDQIRILADKLHTAKTVDEVMGYEGAVARLYFRALSEFLPEEFRFEKRTRQPPTDPFNSMLSFGYTLLMYDFLQCHRADASLAVYRLPACLKGWASGTGVRSDGAMACSDRGCFLPRAGDAPRDRCLVLCEKRGEWWDVPHARGAACFHSGV